MDDLVQSSTDINILRVIEHRMPFYSEQLAAFLLLASQQHIIYFDVTLSNVMPSSHCNDSNDLLLA